MKCYYLTLIFSWSYFKHLIIFIIHCLYSLLLIDFDLNFDSLEIKNLKYFLIQFMWDGHKAASRILIRINMVVVESIKVMYMLD